MAKLTPNVPYDDLGDCSQLAEYHAAWVMESSESVSYLVLSDSRPEHCCSKVVRRASFEDIEALAVGLPMFSQRSYRIGSEQGVVVLKAAVIDRRYQWVVTLEPSIAVGTDDVPVVPRKVVKDHRSTGGSEERYGSTRSAGSALAETERSPRLLIRRQ
jgi:hypothetical protein